MLRSSKSLLPRNRESFYANLDSFLSTTAGGLADIKRHPCPADTESLGQKKKQKTVADSFVAGGLVDLLLNHQLPLNNSILLSRPKMRKICWRRGRKEQETTPFIQLFIVYRHSLMLFTLGV